MRWLLVAVLVVLVSSGSGCRRGVAPRPTEEPDHPEGAEPSRVEAPGLHNVLRLTDRLYSGSSPEGDRGFESLRKLGVQTVLSVDGARPDLERARKYGLRYVHVPIGYDGVPQQQALRIAKAVRDLPGPVYLHCHHGKHRGPAAAAVAHLCLDERCTVDRAVAEMRLAGTDPRYTGLYAAPAKLRRPTKAELDEAPADFPEVAKVTALAQLMVRIDERWEHLKEVRAAGWKVPPGSPDIDPPHEALQLAEHYREAARLVGEKRNHGEELRRWLAEAETGAQRLEAALRAGEKKVARAEAEKAFQRAANDCTRCHVRHRDVPREP